MTGLRVKTVSGVQDKDSYMMGMLRMQKAKRDDPPNAEEKKFLAEKFGPDWYKAEGGVRPDDLMDALEWFRKMMKDMDQQERIEKMVAEQRKVGTDEPPPLRCRKWTSRRALAAAAGQPGKAACSAGTSDKSLVYCVCVVCACTWRHNYAGARVRGPRVPFASNGNTPILVRARRRSADWQQAPHSRLQRVRDAHLGHAHLEFDS